MQGSNEYQTFQKIIKLEYTVPMEVDQTSASLIKNIVKLDPSQRLSLEQILEDPFFTGLQSATIRSLRAPRLSYLVPLKLPAPNVESLYMDPEAYFKAMNMGSTPAQVLGSADSLVEDPGFASDTWLPDLKSTGVDPESILMSAIIKKKIVGSVRTRGILLNKKNLYIYELKTSRLASTYPLDSIQVELIDSTQFAVKIQGEEESRFVIQVGCARYCYLFSLFSLGIEWRY